MDKLVKDFQKLIHLRTAAQVAVWLGYRDTRAINQWLQRGLIPKARIERVKELCHEYRPR